MKAFGLRVYILRRHNLREQLEDPQNVADAIAALVDAPAGRRPFRTVVDKMGMGDNIKPYNDQLEKVITGVYNAFGMGGMLKPAAKVPA